MKTEEILNEREKTHGDYGAVSSAWCGLTTEFDEHYQASDVVLNDKQASAIKMIFLKIARIVCGNPNHADHWDDIAGYAMLGKGEDKEAPCKVCAISIECLGIPCDKHIQKERDRLRKIKEAENSTGSATINEPKFHCFLCKTELRYTGFAALKLCDSCVAGELEKWEKESAEENSTSSKMEHVPKCDRCGEKCETICFTINDIDTNKRFCPRCTGEMAGEACRKKTEHEEKTEQKISEDDVNHLEQQLDSLSGLKLYDVWHDAETCLPIPGRWVTVQCKDTFGQIEEIDYAQLNIIDDRYYWGERFYSDLYNDDGLITMQNKVLKWKYPDEN